MTDKNQEDIKQFFKQNRMFGGDVISVSQFESLTIKFLYDLFISLKNDSSEYSKLLKNKVMTALFYEPSTRTSASFISAMSRLGGSVIPITQGVHYSSVSKGESFEDTIKTLECYSDVIVLRHPEIGSAKIAADITTIPIVNAGDGAGEHPTQALLDVFTIFEEVDCTKELTIAFVGDLRFGRTVHSLVRLLCKLSTNIKFTFVSPEVLRMPTNILDEIRGYNIKYDETSVLNLDIPDIFYITRIQKERFTDEDQYNKLKGTYIITRNSLVDMKQSAIIMHPLPRVGEIHPEVDEDHRAVYFRQVKNGLYARMALLLAVLHG